MSAINDTSSAAPALMQVYIARIKTRREIEIQIPRERWGWWKDTWAGQAMVLRDATPDDIARCPLSVARDSDPADYMCEIVTGGGLVAREAIARIEPKPNLLYRLQASSSASADATPTSVDQHALSVARLIASAPAHMPEAQQVARIQRYVLGAMRWAVGTPQALMPTERVVRLGIVREWPAGMLEQVENVWRARVGFTIDYKLHDLAAVLAEHGFQLTVRESAGPRGGSA